MRGTHDGTPGKKYTKRIIPADAGNTSMGVLFSRLVKDHPRGCGEHAYSRPYGVPHAGSSPRMRGTLATKCVERRINRIIPADAGNTQAAAPRWHPARDHPRGCGEHTSMMPSRASLLGSSPRMRGTPKSEAREDGLHRIIPADAGNTRSCLGIGDARWDHPRGCGEHELHRGHLLSGAGSSPRMRGTRVSVRCRVLCHRIIPADAGNTKPIPGSPTPSTDHPRGCGEHTGRP